MARYVVLWVPETDYLTMKHDLLELVETSRVGGDSGTPAYGCKDTDRHEVRSL